MKEDIFLSRATDKRLNQGGSDRQKTKAKRKTHFRARDGGRKGMRDGSWQTDRMTRAETLRQTGLLQEWLEFGLA